MNTSNGSAKTSFNGNGIAQFGGTNGNDVAYGVAATNSVVCVTGTYGSVSQVGPPVVAGAQINKTGQDVSRLGGNDAYVIALNGNGTPLNNFGINGSGGATFAGTGNDYGSSVALAGTNIFVTGLFSSGVQRFGGGGDDRGVSAYFYGNTIWVLGPLGSTNAGVGGTGTFTTTWVGRRGHIQRGLALPR